MTFVQTFCQFCILKAVCSQENHEHHSHPSQTQSCRGCWDEGNLPARCGSSLGWPQVRVGPPHPSTQRQRRHTIQEDYRGLQIHCTNNIPSKH